jgi:hypothetical protein
MLIRIRLVFMSKRFAAALERLEGGYDILRMPDFECDEFETERAGCGLNLAQLQHGGGITDIGHDRQPAQAGNHLAQKFEPLASKISDLN